uniref:Uncharacterized protein n=1 Tax=Hyaloperonospora arabidopsidis (strain Emoy2) TaxID=559515 RepID=M4BIU9_HYAAE
MSPKLDMIGTVKAFFMSKFGVEKLCRSSIWTCASTTKLITQIFVKYRRDIQFSKLCLQMLQERLVRVSIVVI